MGPQNQNSSRSHFRLENSGLDDPKTLAEMLLALFEEHSDALFLKDLEGKYVLFNRSAGQLTGKAVADVIGKSDSSIFDAESARLLAERDRRVMETGVAETDEEVLTAGGITRIYKAKKAPFLNPDGEVIGVLGISRDITAKREAEAALLRSERLLRLVVQTLPVSVQVMDLEGKSILSNPACERIWGEVFKDGKSRYESVKAYWHDTQVPVKEEEWASARAMHGESTYGQVVDIIPRGGELKTILNTGVPIMDGDTLVGAMVLNEDITERRKLEKRINQAQRMEAVGHLAGGVAHDFNNLLTVISGCCDLLLQEGTHEQLELVEEISEAAQLAGGLTRQLLSFSRKSVCQPRDVHLSVLVKESERMLHRLVGPRVELTIETPPLAGYVTVDPTEFGQILVNLVANARDAMPEGGELFISIPEDDGPDGLVELRVRDTGEGVPEEIVDQIFDPFFTTKSLGGGSGLGLSTVHGIVTRSGGFIDVESSIGAGTTFIIRLPRARKTEKPADPSRPDCLESAENRKILLVEDQDSVRAVLCRALQRGGYNVVETSNGVEAFEYWSEARESIALIVTDVVMPEMGGPELVEKIRQTDPDVKAVFVSGYVNDMLEQQQLSDRRVRFLQKPVPLDELLKEVGEFLEV